MRFILLLILFPSLCLAGQGMYPVPMVYQSAGTAEYLDVDYHVAGTATNLQSSNAKGNSFQVPNAGDVTAVAVYISTVTTSGNMILRVGPNPDLTTVYDEGTLNVTATGWNKVTLDTPLTVTTGTEYYYAVIESGSALKANLVSSGTYANGERLAEVGTPWDNTDTNRTDDWSFRIYVTR